MHVMEHEYVTKGLTETALITLWVVLTKHFLQCMSSASWYQVVPKHIMSFKDYLALTVYYCILFVNCWTAWEFHVEITAKTLS